MKGKAAFIFAFCLLNIGILTAQDADIFSGTYINKESNLIFKVVRRESGFACSMSFKGQTYEFQASIILGILTGQYQYQGQSVPVTFTRLFNNYVLVSEGYTIPMVRDETISLPDVSGTSLHAGSSSASLSRSDWLLPSEKVVSAGGTTIDDPYGRYRLKIPVNWKLEDNESYLKIKKEGSNKTLTIYPHLFKDVDEAMRGVKDLIDPDIGTNLKVSPVRIANDRYMVRLQGMANEKNIYIEYACVLSPQGGGLFINLNLQDEKYSEEIRGLVQSIMATVSFLKPSTAPQVDQWNQKLKGKKLLYLKTDSYSSQRTDLDLFADGTYQYRNETSRMSTGYATLSYAGDSSHSGRWTVGVKAGKPVLLLCEEFAEFFEYPISSSGTSQNEVYLGGRKFFIQ